MPQQGYKDMEEEKSLDATLKQVTDAIYEKKGEEILVLDLGELCNFCRYFVLTTATSTEHLNTLMEEIKNRFNHHNIEGIPQSGWILIDMGDIIVHLFSKEKRDYYRLESLWGDAKTVQISREEKDG